MCSPGDRWGGVPKLDAPARAEGTSILIFQIFYFLFSSTNYNKWVRCKKFFCIFVGMKGLIYKATDVIDGRVYIGQTVQSLIQRKNEHYKGARCGDVNYFHSALREREFEWSVLDEFEGEKDYVIHCLNVAEEYQILKHRSNEQRYGYNSTKGGYSSDKFAEHIKLRMREKSGAVRVLQYGLDGNYIDAYDSLSAVCAKFNVPKLKREELLKGSWHGYIWKLDEGDREMFINPYKPKDGSVPRVFVDVFRTSDGSLVEHNIAKSDASEMYNVSVSRIESDLKRWNGLSISIKEQFALDYVFRRVDESNVKSVNVTIIPVVVKEKKENTPPKSVLQYNLKGELVAEYKSIGEAARVTGKDASTIRRCCCRSGEVVVYESRDSSVWRFAGDTSEMPEIKVYVKGGKVREKKLKHTIEQYSLNGEFIAKYETVREASEATGVNANTINACLYGRSPKKSRFIWKR